MCAPNVMSSTRWMTLVSVLLMLPASVLAQPDSDTVAPRTPWGDPDLQGIWPSGSLVTIPFERPEALGTRAVFTEEEHAGQVQAFEALIETADTRGTGPGLLWGFDFKPPPLKASMVVDPENGRLPPMTDEGARRAQEWRTTSAATYPYAGHEDLRPYDRCISRGVLGSAFPNFYASVTAIFQTPGFVIIRHEMIHETRVIPLDGRPHVASGIRQWMGDSRGRWDGDTLVVETTNFNGRTGSYWRNGDGNPTSEALRLVERIRLSEMKTLEYEVRIEDPETWTEPWTVALSLPRDDAYVMYEYACHEGNYALTNMLQTVRAAERTGAP